MYDTRYAHFSKGDLVRIRDDARRDAPIHDRLPGVGRITGITNAGFRGLEYDGIAFDGAPDGTYFFGISAADLELVTAVKGGPIPWPRQGTYLDGPNGETIRVGA